MKLRILGQERPTEQEVFVSLSSLDNSAINIVFHVQNVGIKIGWVSHRGVISMMSLSSHEQQLLGRAGFEFDGNKLTVQR